VVLAVLVVAAGLIVPRVGRSFGGRELRESAACLAHTARTVKELASASQATFAIELDLDRGRYWVARESGRAGPGRMEPIQMSWLKAVRLPKSVKVAEYRSPEGKTETAGVRQLKFFPDGTSSGARIRLVCGEEQCYMVVHPHNGKVVFGSADASSFPQDQYDLGD